MANHYQLPSIPEKRYFTIGEVAHLCAVKPHVLRYWEQEFPQLKPSKRRGNRRYYQRDDVLIVRKIRSLLYEQGYTIGGARQQLSGKHEKPVPKQPPKEDAAHVPADHSFKELIDELQAVLDDLS